MPGSGLLNNECVCVAEAGAPQPHHIHHVPTARAGARLRQDAVPRRVHARGARAAPRPQRGQGAGNHHPTRSLFHTPKTRVTRVATKLNNSHLFQTV